MERKDYSELVEALEKGDDTVANELLKEVLPRLVQYLEINMQADQDLARESAHQAFHETLERIKDGKIEKKKTILSYLTTATRNQFFKLQHDQHRFEADPSVQDLEVSDQEPLDLLIEKERMELIEKCLMELSKEKREFIRYFFKHPDASTKEAAKDLNMRSGTLRANKSRILNQLHYCYRRKSKQ